MKRSSVIILVIPEFVCSHEKRYLRYSNKGEFREKNFMICRGA